jgi:hypothetical protein
MKTAVIRRAAVALGVAVAVLATGPRAAAQNRATGKPGFPGAPVKHPGFAAPKAYFPPGVPAYKPPVYYPPAKPIVFPPAKPVVPPYWGGYPVYPAYPTWGWGFPTYPWGGFPKWGWFGW